MAKYILKRLLMLIPVILGVAVVIFTIMYFTPGDPITIILGENFTAEQYAETAHNLGLDQPYIVQLLQFLKQTFLEFDMGTSYIYNTDVFTELLVRLPRTATIAAVCCLLQIIIGIPLGVTAATHQGGFLDSFCIILAIVAISVPSFWIAMILVLIFGLNLHWLPSYGIDHWYSYILPCAANCLMGLGSTARQTRSQMLEVIRSDYVVTARAKGVPERTILYSHALPNALIPVVTHLGEQFGRALGGTVVIETVFSIPGVGYYMTSAISNRDYPVVRGGVTLLAVLFCLVIFITDLVYAYIDPRIKAQYEGSQKKRLKKIRKEGAANG
ncbi:MAG: ABC transporter permease [Faecousia sp.]